ncbi:MAG: LEA type 2 family protein [Thermoanaerobaculia bacterium]|nr:LEA type 2 family protein [Thermoanaerobaculia bacterium]
MKQRLTFGAVLAGLCIVLALATVALTGCSLAKTLDIVNPSYSIRDIRPRVDIALPLSSSSIDLDFTIAVNNPNRVGLKLDQIDFNLFINDQRILDGVSRQRINIPANGHGDVRLSTRFGYQQVRTLFTEIADLIRGDRARYEIRGNAWYDTPVGRLKFPVTVYSTGNSDNRR